MNRSTLFFLVLLPVVLTLGACGGGDPPPRQVPEQQTSEEGGMTTASVTLISPAFAEGAAIPVAHTCDGENVSPLLHWSKAPQGVKSWALIVDDPDAPAKTWVHWVLFNVPADARTLEMGIPALEELENGTRHGKTDFGTVGYGGPCPPPGGPHRYLFKLYALDTMLSAKPGLTKSRLLDEMQGHILAKGELMGTFESR